MLYKFQQGPKKYGGQLSVVVPPIKSSLRSPAANKRQDVVYEIPCGVCEHTYTGEMK